MNTSPSQRLVVHVPLQRADLLDQDGTVLASWLVSTSRFGLGCEEGSFRTPTGNFRIAEKIGAGEPPWTVYKSRVPTGERATPGGSDDLVLTRILWLEGQDPENCNTRERYIYLHGTNQEELIGTPASHGCVRLSNEAIIDLFERVAVGTPVEIRA